MGSLGEFLTEGTVSGGARPSRSLAYVKSTLRGSEVPQRWALRALGFWLWGGGEGPPTSQGLYSLLHAKRSNCWRAPQEMRVVVQYRGTRVACAPAVLFVQGAVWRYCPRSGLVVRHAWNDSYSLGRLRCVYGCKVAAPP